MTTRRQSRVTRYDDGNGVGPDRAQNNKQQEEQSGEQDASISECDSDMCGENATDRWAGGRSRRER